MANALAWAASMPLTFLTIDVATAQSGLPATLTLIVLGMTLTGALVGGIHGRFLEKLLPR